MASEDDGEKMDTMTMVMMHGPNKRRSQREARARPIEGSVYIFPRGRSPM